MAYLEITVDSYTSTHTQQSTGWREPSKKLQIVGLETHKIYIENVNVNINKEDISDFSDYSQFQDIIDKKILEIYEIRVKTSMYMNISISSKLPVLLGVKLFT
jgi:hypothetical protein